MVQIAGRLFALTAADETRGPGGLDWLTCWEQLIDAAAAQSAAVREQRGVAFADPWAERAGRFAASVQRVDRPPDPLLALLTPQLRPGDVVLDIGAGTGRHTLALADLGTSVIAVEPSAAMRSQLEQRLSPEARPRVTVVEASWPQAVVPRCSIAIAAHVIYGVREIGPFLLAMDATAERLCVVVAGFQPPSAWTGAFWERVYGQPRAPLPGALECLNVLAQLGIAANLSLAPAQRYVLRDEAEALADLRARLHLPPTPEADALLRQAVADLLVRDADGRLTAPNQPTHTALIWWEPTASTGS